MEREEVGVGERFEFLYRRGVGRGGGLRMGYIFTTTFFSDTSHLRKISSRLMSHFVN